MSSEEHKQGLRLRWPALILTGCLLMLVYLGFLWAGFRQQADVKAIAGFEALRVNWLGRVWAVQLDGVTDAEVLQLQQTQLPRLQRLFVTNSQLTSTGVDSLRTYRNLQELNLTGTQLPAEALQILPQLASLQKLDLTNTSLDSASIRKLQEQLPHTRIFD